MTMGGTGSEEKPKATRNGARARPLRQRKSVPKPTKPGAPADSGAPQPAASLTPGAPRKRTPRAKPHAPQSVPASGAAAPVVQPSAPDTDERIVPVEVVAEVAPRGEDITLPEPEAPGESIAAEPALADSAAEEGAAATPGETPVAEMPAELEPSDGAAPRATRGRHGRERGTGHRGNALGALIEQRFSDPSSPVRSYSELERRSAISREALSRYVTPRADRRRSPTIDTLAAISDSLHLSLEQVCRAAVASSRGLTLPPESEQRARDEVVAPLLAPLTEDQFAAVVELLRQMQAR